MGCRSWQLPYAVVFSFLSDLKMVEALATLVNETDLLQNYFKIIFQGTTIFSVVKHSCYPRRKPRFVF